jgi:hypothetical protein
MRTEIPDRFRQEIERFIAEVQSGRWPGGGQVLMNISPQGVVTSIEAKGRYS